MHELRLRPRDLAILAAESPTTPMHNATVEIFDPGDSGFDHDRLVQLIADRIAFVPRYRQRLQLVPGRLANPAWVDDDELRPRLPRTTLRAAAPGIDGPAARARRAHRVAAARPEPSAVGVLLRGGPRHGRVALLTKSHQILVDGRETVDIGQVLLDTSPDRSTLGHDDDWRPGRAGRTRRRLPSPR